MDNKVLVIPAPHLMLSYYQFLIIFKGDSNPNDKYVLSEKALRTMNFDTRIIKIG